MNIGIILGWKHGHAPGIATRDGVITEWPAALGPLPTQAQIDTWAAEYEAHQARADLTAAVQAHMDEVAQGRGYDNIFTACTYADEPAVPSFQAEGQALRAWRSRVWAHCHTVLADVQAGTRGIPTAAELVAELPAP